MRKRKFAGGMVALCLVLSVAGCGKTSEEKQAANYYQNELGLDKDEAEELAHEIYGKDKDEEKPGATEAPGETVIEPLPELVNSEWWERKVQILDMVFPNDWTMTEEDIRKIVEGSAYDVEIVEKFDQNGELYIDTLKLNGEIMFYSHVFESSDYYYRAAKSFGWYNDEPRYHFSDPLIFVEGVYHYDNRSISSEGLDFKTRDDVLAYLSENGFVEMEDGQACYGYSRFSPGRADLDPCLFSDKISVEYADTPHYICHGVQSIAIYRMHKLDETDEEIEFRNLKYSGASLYLFAEESIDFNTDGTIRQWSSKRPREAVIVGPEIK